MAAKPDFYTEEFLQNRLERQIREEYELHGWAVISTSNPVNILIELEEEYDDTQPKKRAIS